MESSEELLADPDWNKKMYVSTKYRDADGDGVITLADFEIVLGRYATICGASAEQIEYAKQQLVPIAKNLKMTDATVKVSYEEFKQGVAKFAARPDRRNFMESMFYMIDIDESGYIDYDEWVKHYMCNGVPIEFAEKSFAAMDANGDGKISKEEFTDFHEEFFYSTENKYGSLEMFGPLDQFDKINDHKET